MSKLILLMSFVCLGVLLTLNLLFADSSILWLASSSQDINIVRAVMMFILAVLLVTNPPRNIALRSLIGATAIFVLAWCLRATYNNQMQVLDSLAFALASVAAGLDVLEQGIQKQADKVSVKPKTKHRHA